MKTVCIPEELHKELVELKLEERKKNAAEMIKELILEHKKKRFLMASNLFKKSLEEKKIGFLELLKKSRAIRKEISDEWF